MTCLILSLISSSLAALVGFLFALLQGLTPQMGCKQGIWIFVVVIVAGFGKISGIAVASLIAGVIIAAVAYWMSPYAYVTAVLFGIMSIPLFARSNGMFGIQLRRL